MTSYLQKQIFGQSEIVSFAVELRHVALQYFSMQFVLKISRTSAYPEASIAFQQLKDY